MHKAPAADAGWPVKPEWRITKRRQTKEKHAMALPATSGVDFVMTMRIAAIFFWQVEMCTRPGDMRR